MEACKAEQDKSNSFQGNYVFNAYNLYIYELKLFFKIYFPH